MLTPEDLARFVGQNRAILERLSRGPCTNRELSGIALKYTGRILELRQAGVDIRCERRPGGLCWYSLAVSTQKPPRVVDEHNQVSLFAAGEDRSHV